MRYGLSISDRHYGYVGYRAIFNGLHVDVVHDRGTTYGDHDSINRLLKWANTVRVLPPLPGKKSARKMSPWAQMLKEVPRELGPRDSADWEISEGNYVLRCNPQASCGYLYIALFDRFNPEQRVRDLLKEHPDVALRIAEAAVLGCKMKLQVEKGTYKVTYRLLHEDEQLDSMDSIVDCVNAEPVICDAIAAMHEITTWSH